MASRITTFVGPRYSLQSADGDLFMTMQYSYGRPRGSGPFFGVLLAMILGATAVAVFVHHARSGIAGRIAAQIAGRPLVLISPAEVVQKLNQLNRLQTAEDSLDIVIDTAAEGNPEHPVSGVAAPAGEPASGDRTRADARSISPQWIIVHGQTTAGIDMSKLRPEDVLITGTASDPSVRLSLPPAEILGNQIDPKKTRTYAPSTGSLTQLNLTLDQQVQKRALAQFQQAAVTDGILNTATKDARATLALILEDWGFEHVEFR
ncbi:MAG: DUF4230 domain-containing protein [Acidobacteriaceae bacterium]